MRDKKQKSLKGKLSSAFKKVALVGVLVGTAAIPASYNYGTIQTVEVKVTDVQQTYLGYDREAGKGLYDYKIITEKGTFENDDSLLHLKSNAADIQKSLKKGEVYQIQYYGLTTPVTSGPNVLSVKHISADELKAREEAAAAQASAPPVAPQPSAQAGQSCVMTGEVSTYNVVNGDYILQITVPKEVAGKVSINTVKPINPPAP